LASSNGWGREDEMKLDFPLRDMKNEMREKIYDMFLLLPSTIKYLHPILENISPYSED
jgi:hypothetical protein